jgi:hypothetical protein
MARAFAAGPGEGHFGNTLNEPTADLLFSLPWWYNDFIPILYAKPDGCICHHLCLIVATF